jgi:type IV / VI secretion system protein, DotU family
MRLSDYFVPIIAVIKGAMNSPETAPDTLAAHIDSLIQQAQSRALQHDIGLDRFQAGLFPVLAWADETISRHHRWTEEHAWQKYLLQRRYFKTGLAGREFFERLDSLPAQDAHVREVYLMCLCLGFMGRYSLTPNSAELANIRIEQYKLLQQADPAFQAASDNALFPHAYIMAESASGATRTAVRSPFMRRLTWRRALFYLLPPIIVILVALVLHNELTNAVQHFRETADL